LYLHPGSPGCAWRYGRGTNGRAMVISHDRWFLDRIATHILDYQDEGKVEFFEGNFTFILVVQDVRGDTVEEPTVVRWLS
ncbi:hypothetical protein PSY57_23530, partial [Shigella flexneri]|nr:hypothetical protein [Shigella flexneri]